TSTEFPPDDSGHGFDSIGEVLTLSPLLLEKYLAAARSIVMQAVPVTSRVVAQTTIPGTRFRRAGDRSKEANGQGPLSLSFYGAGTVSAKLPVEHAGHYVLDLDLTTNERYVDGVFDYNKCRLTLKVDGTELFGQDFSRQEGRPHHFEFKQEWKAGT